MLKLKSLTILFIVVFSIVFFVYQPVNAYDIGDVMHTSHGVPAKSNGDANMGSNDIVEHPYQCVEYVKRFYRDAYGVCLYSPIGVARNYYVGFDNSTYSYLRESGLVRYANGGATPPKPGDIIVYDDSSSNIGHVAIVMEVNGSTVSTIEQNWDLDGVYDLSMNYSGGNYTISSRGSYSVLGWLHMPVGEYSNGWHYNDISYNEPVQSQPFVDTYLSNGGSSLLGFPTDNVHGMPYGSGEIWWQDFEKDGHVYSLVRNDFVYNTTRLYLGVVYPVHGQIRDYWINAYWVYGPPVCNEYFWPEGTTDYVVQWFEPTDNYYVSIAYQIATGNFYVDLSGLYPDSRLDQDKLSNCASDTEGCGGGPMITDPANLTASALSESSISLVMSLPENAGDYDQTVVIRDGNILSTHDTVSSNLIVSGLSAGENYCFRVRLQNSSSGLQSEVSNEACATTDSSPPPPPPPDYTVEEAVMSEGVEASVPYGYVNPNYTYAKSPGLDAYTWMRVSSTNANLAFEWKLYYHPTNLGVCEASQGPGCPYSYLSSTSSYYDANNNEYRVWHYIDSTNSLPSEFGQYRVELWIDGVKAKIIYFNLILETPLRPNLNGDPTVEEVNLVSYPVPGAAKQELYRDNDYIGDFDYHLFKDTNVVPGATHEYRVMEVSANGFRSEPSQTRVVVIPSLDSSSRSYVDHLLTADLNANGSPEVAALRLDETSKQPTVVVVDSDTGAEINRVLYFWANCEPRELISYGDLNANGAPELAVLVYDFVSQRTRYEIRDALTGELFVEQGTAPDPPTGFTTQTVTESQVIICWTAVADADEYLIYRNGVYIGTTTDICFTDNTVSAGNFYLYTLRSVKDGVMSAFSDEFAVATPGGGGGATCASKNYIEHAYYEDAGVRKIVVLAECLDDDSPVLYIVDVNTGSVEEEIAYFSVNYTPIAMTKYNIGDDVLFGVLAKSDITGETEIEIRYVPSGIIY